MKIKEYTREYIILEDGTVHKYIKAPGKFCEDCSCSMENNLCRLELDDEYERSPCLQQGRDGVFELTDLTIRDINPLMVNKIHFYEKLLVKIEKIIAGELDINDYKKEIEEKIK